jgi:membrane-bound ClpP family serine protease
MKNVIKEVAKDYNLNPKALKYYVKENDIKPRAATRLQVLEVVYIYCPELFYSRFDVESGTVDYLDINLNKKLCYELRELRGSL